MTTQSTTEQTKQTVEKQPSQPQIQTMSEMFGNGRFSRCMEELFKDTIRLLHFTPKQARKVALAFGRDCGKLPSNAKGVTFGKVNLKTGMLTVKEAVNSVKTNLTYSFSIAKICSTLQDLKVYGVETYTEIKFRNNIQLWIDSAEETASQV